MSQVSFLRAHLYAFLATVLIGGSFIASGELANCMNPYALTLLRFIGAVVVLAPFVLYHSCHRRALWRTLPRSLIISFFYTAFFIAQLQALKSSPVINTSALYTLVPMLTAVLSTCLFKTTLGRYRLLIFLLGLLATLWVIFQGDIQKLLSLSFHRGDGIFLLAVLAIACYTLSMKFLYRGDAMILLVFCNLLGGCLWLIAALFLFQVEFSMDSLQACSMAYLLYLSLATTLLTSYLFQSAATTLEPGSLSAYTYLTPSLVALLLLCFYQIPIDRAIIPGMILSVLATCLLQGSRKM